MAKGLYNFGINVYYLFIRLISPFNKKAKLWINGRVNLPINSGVHSSSILVHCSSYGEFEQAYIFIQQLKFKYPNRNMVVSFFSPSGYEKIKLPDFVDQKIYLPRDFSKNYKHLVSEFSIEKVILVKYEIWPNMIQFFLKEKTEVHLISSRFYPKHFVFKPFGKWVITLLKQFKSIHLIDQLSFDLLNEEGFNNIYLSGDTRYDKVLNNLHSPVEYSLEFSSKKPSIIFASLWFSDLKVIGEEVIKLSNSFNFIVAPHEVSGKDFELVKQFFLRLGTLTEFSQKNSNQVISDGTLLMDTIGDLKYMYQFADQCYVGGGFGKGIHNILEPLAFKIPVIFGENHQQFSEAIEAIKMNIGFSFSNCNEFSNHVRTISTLNLEHSISEFLNSKMGASIKIVNSI